MRCLRLFVLPKSQIQTHTHILISHRSVHSDTRRKSEERRSRRARGNGWAPPFTASTIVSLLDPLPLFCWAVSSNKPSSHRKHGIAGRMKRPLDPYIWIQRPMETDTVTGGKRNAPRPCMMSSLLAQSVTDTREWLVLSRRLPRWRWTGSTLSLPPLLFLRKLIGWKKRCLLFCVANFSRRTSKPSATRPTALFKQGKRRNWRSAWWGFDVSQGTAGVSALGSCQSYSASAAVCNLSVTADFENAFNWRGHLGSLLLCCPLSRPIASPPYRPCHLCRELHQYLLSAGFWVEYEGEKKYSGHLSFPSIS